MMITIMILPAMITARTFEVRAIAILITIDDRLSAPLKIYCAGVALEV